MEGMNCSSGDVQSPEEGAPFIVTLPLSGVTYFEILKPPHSVTMRSGLVTLRAGEDAGSHNTGKNEEILVILDGQGWVESEGARSQKITRGQIAYIPPDTQHNILNRDEQPLQYVFIVARAD